MTVFLRWRTRSRAQICEKSKNKLKKSTFLGQFLTNFQFFQLFWGFLQKITFLSYSPPQKTRVGSFSGSISVDFCRKQHFLIFIVTKTWRYRYIRFKWKIAKHFFWKMSLPPFFVVGNTMEMLFFAKNLEKVEKKWKFVKNWPKKVDFFKSYIGLKTHPQEFFEKFLYSVVQRIK